MSTACDEYKNELSALTEKLGNDFKGIMEAKSNSFKNEINGMTDDLPDTEGVDASIGIDFDVDWKLQVIKLHLPEVVMKLQTWKFHLPSVTMKDKRIIFHTPSVRMVPKKIGQYPEFHGLRIVWKDIITHVPETFMQKQEIVMGIPELRMEENEIKLHVPEFAMRLQEIKLHLPEFRLRDITVEAGRIKDKAEEATGEFNSLISTEKKKFFEAGREQITGAVGKLFSCHRTQIQNKKDETLKAFEPGIANTRTAIEKLKSTGASEHVPNLENQLQKLIQQKSSVGQNFENAIAEMLKKEKQTVQLIMDRMSGE